MSRLDAIVGQIALALVRTHGYRPRRRRKPAVRPPPHWHPQFRSEADWRSWCARDATSEAFEMSDLSRAA